MWYDEIKSVSDKKSTRKEYTRYNNAFQKWFDTTYGITAEITSESVRRHIQISSELGKSTKV